MNIFIRK